jgi:hypothetical protein
MPKGNTEGYPLWMGDAIDPKARKLSEFDMENNAGAKMVNKSFEKTDGSFGTLDDVTKANTGRMNLDVAGADTRGPM